MKHFIDFLFAAAVVFVPVVSASAQSTPSESSAPIVVTTQVARTSNDSIAPSAMPARVVLRWASTCAAMEVSRSELERLLRIELMNDGISQFDVAEIVEGADDNTLAVLRIEPVQCEITTTAFNILVDDLATHRTAQASINVADVADGGRTRALAISVVEILRSAWPSLSAQEVLPVQQSSPQPQPQQAVVVSITVRLEPSAFIAPAPTQAAASSCESCGQSAGYFGPSRFAFDAAFNLTSSPDLDTALFGGRATFSFLPSDTLSLRLAFSVGAASGRSFGVSSLSNSVATLYDIGFGMAYVARIGAFALDIGPHIDFAYAETEAVPGSTGPDSGLYTGFTVIPSLDVLASWQLGSGIRLFVGGAVGYALPSVVSYLDTAVTGVGGLQVSGRTGVGYAW